jgi:branched-chain amino acid transport system substrate-binding protein
MGQIPFITEDPVANPLTFPAQGDAALGIVMATNWHIGLDNAANKKFVGAFRAKYNRDPATFAALGYDAVKAIDAAVRGVNGNIENKDALRASMRKANFDSVRGKFKFNNNQFPIQDLFMMEVAKDANGGLTSKLKEVVIKDWQDPLHTQCPMKW